MSRPAGSGRKKGSAVYTDRLELRVEPATTAALKRAVEELDVKLADLLRVYVEAGLRDDGFLPAAVPADEPKRRRKS